MKTASFKTYGGPGRISIARFTPRGCPPGYKIFKALAPGPWFNSVSRERYIELYNEEVLRLLDPTDIWERLHKLAGGAEPHLMCWEKPPLDDVKNWCHRRMVATWLEEKLGVSVPEFEFEARVSP
jgi:hypothetical protein